MNPEHKPQPKKDKRKRIALEILIGIVLISALAYWVGAVLQIIKLTP